MLFLHLHQAKFQTEMLQMCLQKISLCSWAPVHQIPGVPATCLGNSERQVMRICQCRVKAVIPNWHWFETEPPLLKQPKHILQILTIIVWISLGWSHLGGVRYSIRNCTKPHQAASLSQRSFMNRADMVWSECQRLILWYQGKTSCFSFATWSSYLPPWVVSRRQGGTGLQFL